jgi:hypothetical protein
MSNFFYKGISISTITNTSGTTANAPGYDNFPILPANYSGFIPNDFSYYYTDDEGNLQPVSQLCTATSTQIDFSSSLVQTIPIPIGCNSFYVIATGAGGGGGGGGGAVNGTNEGGNTANGNGGNGAPGGSGATTIGLFNVVPDYSTVSVTVGGGGSYGSGGPTNHVVHSEDGAGTDGNGGKAGGNTNVTYVSTTITGPCGDGGNAGLGGTANFGNEYFTTNGGNGNQGNSGTGSNPYTPLNFPMPTPQYGYGGPGGNGNNGGGPGTAGADGSAQIIWLYD